MPGTVGFVVDTNLFHECLSLDASEFPWSDIGDFEVIELYVSDPVQTELDEHKKDTRSRIKRRAVQAISWFREMLRTGSFEHVFREQNPRVVMRLIAQTASSDYPEFLDLKINDDRIVAVAAALSKSNPQRDVRVLSDDTRPIAKAKAIGMNFEFIPKSWLRVAEMDEQEKENVKLKAEIAELRSSHPVLTVEAVGAVDRRLTLERKAFSSLSEEEIALVRKQIAKHFNLNAIEQAFSNPRRTQLLEGLAFRGNDIHVRPTEAQVLEYRNTTYQEWLDECAAHVRRLPMLKNDRCATSPAIITIINSGFRPAENVRIRFTAKGKFLIAPLGNEPYEPDLGELPPLPRPPMGQWLRDGRPVGTAVALRDRMTYENLDLAGLIRRNRDDEEAWYYEPKRPEVPVTSYELECQRFRHGGETMKFNIVIFPQSHQDKISGAIQVEVNASNVPRHREIVFPLQVNTEFESPTDLIDNFLDNAMKRKVNGKIISG